MRRPRPLCRFNEPMLERCQLANYRVMMTTVGTSSENAIVVMPQFRLGSADMEHARSRPAVVFGWRNWTSGRADGADRTRIFFNRWRSDGVRSFQSGLWDLGYLRDVRDNKVG